MNKDHIHSLKGENISFRKVNPNNVSEIHEFVSDEEVSRYIGWRLMETEDETREYIETMLKRESEGTHLYASVVLNGTEEIVGIVMMFDFDMNTGQAEIGYVFHKKYWGKGYGRESVVLIKDFAFQELGLHRLHASVVDCNLGSARILEKNGFQLEGRLRDHYYIDEKYHDALLYGLINQPIGQES